MADDEDSVVPLHHRRNAAALAASGGTWPARARVTAEHVAEAEAQMAATGRDEATLVVDGHEVLITRSPKLD